MFLQKFVKGRWEPYRICTLSYSYDEAIRVSYEQPTLYRCVTENGIILTITDKDKMLLSDIDLDTLRDYRADLEEILHEEKTKKKKK